MARLQYISTEALAGQAWHAERYNKKSCYFKN